MAEIRDTLRLEIDEALRSIDQIEQRLDRATTTRIDVDTTSARTLASALETAERAAATLRGETNDTAAAAGRAQRSYSDLADSLGVSEARAAQLAGEAREAALSAAQIERQSRDIADAMGLSERETRQFVSSLRSADRAADSTADSSDRIVTSLRRVGGVAATALGAFLGFQAIEGLVRAAGGAITAYSDSVEEASKAQTVFGASFEIVNQFVSDSADTLRASRTEALAAAGAFGTFFRGIGFAEGAAARLSTQTVQLAADLASFNNLNFDEALEKLRSGLAGETEPLRQLGAGFNEAELQAKALELGLGGATGALSEQEKVTARLALITERTASAQGDAARTADTLAGRLRRAQAEARNLAPAFGEALLPVVETLLDVAPDLIRNLEDLVPVVQELATQFAEAGPGIVAFAEGIPGAIREVESVGRFLRDGAQAAGAFGTALSSFTAIGLADMIDIGDGEGVTVSFDRITESVSNLQNELQDVSIDRALNTISDALAAGQSPAQAFATAIEKLGDGVELTEDRLADLSRFAGLENLPITELNNLAGSLSTFQIPPGQTDAVLAEIDRIRLAILSLQFNDRTAENIIGAQIAEGIAQVAAESQAAAAAARPSLESLFLTAEEGGQTFLELARDVATSNTSLLDGLSGADAVRGGLQLIAESAEGAAGRYRDAFDVILTKTVETTQGVSEEVNRSAEELAADFETQAQRFADFQAAIATLQLSGFDDLAASLAAEGPAALDAALGFLDDTDVATRAERALEGQGVEIADDIERQLQDAVEGTDWSAIGTDVGLGLAEGITSPAVLAAIDAAGQRVADRMERGVTVPLEVRSPSRVFMRIGENVGEGLVIGFERAANRRVPALTGVDMPDFAGFSGGSRGGGSMTNINIANSVTLAERDAGLATAIHMQQVGQVGAALRGFSGASVRA